MHPAPNARTVCGKERKNSERSGIRVDDALAAIDDSTLGDVLAPHVMAQLRMVRLLARSFADVAGDVHEEIDTRYRERSVLPPPQGRKP